MIAEIIAQKKHFESLTQEEKMAEQQEAMQLQQKFQGLMQACDNKQRQILGSKM